MNYSGILPFVRYFLFSRHRKGHGIHSPFVFHLVSEIFRNKIDPDIVFTIESLRKELLSSRESINVNDLGSGAQRKTNLRKVADIARYSSVPRKYGILLSNLSAEFGKPSILELGTSFGISTMYMAAAAPDSTVHTVEGCRSAANIAAACFRKAGLSNIELHCGAFDDVLPALKKDMPAPGLVFIDGNHRKEPLVKYCREIAGFSDDNTVIVIDDIHSSAEMESAWKEAMQTGKVTLAIDLFRFGILFFRKGLDHLCYTIRY